MTSHKISAGYVLFCQLVLLWHYSFGTSTVSITTAATNRAINSDIVLQSIRVIESKELHEDPESLVTGLLERVDSAIASPEALFNSKYAYKNDFIKAIFEHTKPMLEEAKVP